MNDSTFGADVKTNNIFDPNWLLGHKGLRISYNKGLTVNKNFLG